MKTERLKSNFRYAYGIWLFLPVVAEKMIENYPLFLVRGLLFAAVLGTMFEGMDWLWRRLIQLNK